MRHFALLLLTILLATSYSFSQETNKIKELGFSTSNFSDFGIIYRQGNQKSLWRYSLISSFVGSSNEENNDYESSSSSFGIALQVGKEWRKIITSNFELRYGADIGFMYSTSHNDRFIKTTQTYSYDNTYHNYSPKITAILGFNFVFADNFLVGAEFLPSLAYTKRVAKTYDSFNDMYNTNKSNYYDFGFSTQSMRLSLAYRF